MIEIILANFATQINNEFLPKMLEKNDGHIVTISSMAGKVGLNLLTDYW